MPKLSIEDIAASNKKVLMRVDFNVPLKSGEVVNDKRIRAALPSIQYLLDRGARLVLMSHLGRPKGQRNVDMSLRPCAAILEELLGTPVDFADDCIGDTAMAAVDLLEPGKALLLENLRFHPQEIENDPGFAHQLSLLGDLFVNDAFGTAHRAHASTEGVTHYIQPCVAGFLIQKELQYLGKIMDDPQHPFVAILGGAKVSGKIDVIQNLLPKVDRLLIGGGMVFTFFKAQGYSIGNSLVEEEKIVLAKELLAQSGGKIVLPVDCMVSTAFNFENGTVGPLEKVAATAIPEGTTGLDIGPDSISTFQHILKSAKSVVWNGPMGVFEIDDTALGTFQIAEVLADLTDQGAVTVIGGGDSAAAAEKAGVASRISHISTGGGASLEFLEGKTLPGIAALTDK